MFKNLQIPKIAALLFMLGMYFPSFGQIMIKGQVVSVDMQPLVGASIMEKQSSNGTITDLDGNFELSVKNSGTTLIISYVGYRTQELIANPGSAVKIVLEEDAIGLSEVTVTALGIKREKKALGYAVQEVKGDDIIKARETNLLNSLAGKVAGVTVVGNPSGIGSSSRISIRGERSLNINNNQPLFVVDGVPISNGFSGSSGRSFQEVDYGNGAGFVNPDDVESMTILKGANATALYGSRAANGAIVIKTKTGSANKGIGVSINSTTTFENVLKLPEYQNVYGQGLNGEFNFVDGNGGGLRDGVDENWGPAMNGQLLDQFDSPTSNGFRAGDVGNLFTQIGPVALADQLEARGTITPTPFTALPNNIKDFFETGVTYSNNIALSGSNDKSDFRASFTALNQTGIVPNTDLKRYTTSLNGGYTFSDKLKARVNANYMTNKSNNRPNLSYGTENIMYLINCWLPRNTNLASMKDYWQKGREGLNQYNFNYNYHDNPYFNLYENTNGQDLNRIFGNVSLNYQIAPALSLMLRSGLDVNNEFRDRRRAYSTQRFKLGSYREEKVFSEERNSDFLLTYNPAVNGAFKYTLSLGGNRLDQRYKLSDISAPELAVPGIYSLNNSRVALQYFTFSSKKRINSLYGFGNFSYNDYLFLDLSVRNDWSSSLPKENNSYLYYSASSGLIFTDLLKINSDVLSYGKLRVGLAQVGNDTNPYQLRATYTSQTPANGNPSYEESGALPNAELKPEISTSFEVGTELKFLLNRVGLDLTYYNTNSENQILPIQLSNTTGYSTRIINAGLIQNNGFEAVLHLTPVKNTKGLTWDVDVNWSANRSTVKELYTDPQSGQEINSYVMASQYVTVEARVGERMGAMYGIGFVRVSADPASKYYDKTGEHVGEIVYSSNGKPLATTERIKLGNYNPDWLAGLRNTLSYKGLSLSVLFDHRQGGKIYSHTQTVGREGGIIIETLEGRADGYDLTKEGNGVIGDGVVQNADGTFSDNTTKLSAREWHTSITLGRRLIEPMMYDATFTKLREVQFSYTLPNKLTSKLKIKDVNISLVGRNLMLWSKVPHVDPETSATSGGTIIPGVEAVAIPSTRSFGVNLGLKF
ncbi:MAG TPA: SusC/RagA family TonB-linked outer membrane protein [Saprospiraceae bacterium]|nr:SusC/RagA family TonB-linked outer membrane protein [Saprospiraceae bacterium]